MTYMTNMLGYFMTIISLLSYCSGVGIDYYNEKNVPEERTEDFSEIFPYTRRSIDKEDILQNYNISVHNLSDFSKLSKTTKYNFTHHHFFYSTSFANYETTFFNLSITDDATTSVVNPKVTTVRSDTLKDYEYIYDDDIKPYILREYIQKSSPYIQTNNSGNNLKSPLTEFYNLEPAVQFLNLNVQHKYSKCKNLRYVLEDLPCWELPLLYGEFGKQKKTSEVFLMNGGELKNVIEKNNEEKWQQTHEIASISLTYYTNKWCKFAPCYGDHTLCLFDHDRVSSICDESYIVKVPNILEQTDLINTINSMRNKIANGESDRYSHLPSAANMKQMIYDYDLENFARVWLLQCLPGPEPCSALDGTFVSQLECTKFAKYCCVKSFSSQLKKCTPKPECFTTPIIGCLHVWFWNAGDNLTSTDVQCGHMSPLSYSTAQILWATTNKIGCAYGKKSNGDVRVICNFSPGAPFVVDARFYCGILSLKGGTNITSETNISDTNFLKSFGININQNIKRSEKKWDNVTNSKQSKLKFDEDTNIYWGIDILNKIYTERWIRDKIKDYTNGTSDMIARLVVKYKFNELNGDRCDSEEPIYIIGSPGSLCVERGRRYQGLCYDFRDPTPGYRLVAVIAPIALFSLILYDLFSGVVRQTNY